MTNNGNKTKVIASPELREGIEKELGVNKTAVTPQLLILYKVEKDLLAAIENGNCSAPEGLDLFTRKIVEAAEIAEKYNLEILLNFTSLYSVLIPNSELCILLYILCMKELVQVASEEKINAGKERAEKMAKEMGVVVKEKGE